MSEKAYFNGPFAPMCEAFVAQKRACGLDYSQQAMLLRMFDNFCKDFEIKEYTVTEEVALAWAQLRPNEKDVTRYGRVSEMQRFSEYLRKQGYQSYLCPELPRFSHTHVPYIFSKDEMHRIFARLESLEAVSGAPFRALALTLLFRILYGCGLRISEALDIQKGDVDLENGTLHIRHGKNGNERIVPMSSTLTAECSKFMLAAHKNTVASTPFIYAKGHKRYSNSYIGKLFRGILWDVGIPYRGKDYGPRLHDIRHTFACHNIQAWAESGVSIYSNLLVLSRYLGHTSISATQWYLHLTAQVYPHIQDVCEKELGGMYAPFELDVESEASCNE